jgi:hypothetical protein
MEKARSGKRLLNKDLEVFKYFVCSLDNHKPEKWNTHIRGRDYERMVARVQLILQLDDDRIYANEGGRCNKILNKDDKIIQRFKLRDHSFPT